MNETTARAMERAAEITDGMGEAQLWELYHKGKRAGLPAWALGAILGAIAHNVKDA